MAATPRQSNLTIFCGNDGRMLMNAQNSIDLNNKFTKEMLFENCKLNIDENIFLSINSFFFFFRDENIREEVQLGSVQIFKFLEFFI